MRLAEDDRMMVLVLEVEVLVLVESCWGRRSRKISEWENNQRNPAEKTVSSAW